MGDPSTLGQRTHDTIQIFNASHMAPFDVPHITHDMILRFMGVNFSAIVDGSARIPSSIGTKTKPVFIVTSSGKSTNLPVSGKTPEQDKAMWEGEPPAWFCASHLLTADPISAYYNAGSAALILVLVFVGIGVFMWCRVRNNSVRLPQKNGAEESIPLTSSHHNGHVDEDEDGQDPYSTKQSGKGKAREVENGYSEEDMREPVFNVGDSDDELDTGHARP